MTPRLIAATGRQMGAPKQRHRHRLATSRAAQSSKSDGEFQRFNDLLDQALGQVDGGPGRQTHRMQGPVANLLSQARRFTEATSRVARTPLNTPNLAQVLQGLGLRSSNFQGARTGERPAQRFLAAGDIRRGDPCSAQRHLSARRIMNLRRVEKRGDRSFEVVQAGLGGTRAPKATTGLEVAAPQDGAVTARHRTGSNPLQVRERLAGAIRLPPKRGARQQEAIEVRTRLGVLDGGVEARPFDLEQAVMGVHVLERQPRSSRRGSVVSSRQSEQRVGLGDLSRRDFRRVPPKRPRLPTSDVGQHAFGKARGHLTSIVSGNSNAE